jgi:hypothetical protein
LLNNDRSTLYATSLQAISMSAIGREETFTLPWVPSTDAWTYSLLRTYGEPQGIEA